MAAQVEGLEVSGPDVAPSDEVLTTGPCARMH